jgi:septum site-determining protein MinD
MRYADEAIIVTNPEVSSVRDSDRIIGLLDSKTVRAEKGEVVKKHLPLSRPSSAITSGRSPARFCRRAS